MDQHGHPSGTGTHDAPDLTLASGPEGSVLAVSGEWIVLTIGAVEKKLSAIVAASGPIARIDLTRLSRLDTSGALMLHNAAAACRSRGGKALLESSDSDHARLLEQTVPIEHTPSATPKVKPFVGFLNELGSNIIEEVHIAGKMLSFLGEYLVTLFHSLLRPHTIRLTSLVYHMQQVGVAAVPIVALLSFLIGMVVAYMGSDLLSRFGVQIYAIDMVEVTSLRELAVLMTSILVAGRSGSAFTAEIGAMVANEEVAAMRSMGLNPISLLVMPRVTALLIMLPALVFLADIMSLLGGGAAVWASMDLGPKAFASRVQDVMQLKHFYVGMIKAPFFAIVIGIVGCFQGFQVTGSAESVGRLTTQSVVESIFLVIVLDALFAIFFTTIGV